MRHSVEKSRWLAVAALVVTCVACGLLPSGAFASSAFGLNARTLWVTFEPTDADVATSVRIQGLIAAPGTTQDFLTPVCGYLYYTCKPGDEALCREQWKDLAQSVLTEQCVLFSARRDQNGNLANPGRVRPFSEAPASPDVYGARSGLGVMTMACGAEFSATCTVPRDALGGAGGKGGAGGNGAVGPGGAGGSAIGGMGGNAAGGAAAGGKGGLGGGGVSGQAGAGGTGLGGTMATGGASATGGSASGGSAGSAGSGGSLGLSTGGAGGSAPVIDAAADAPAQNAKGGGCAVVGDGASPFVALGGGVLALAWIARRRRRGGP